MVKLKTSILWTIPKEEYEALLKTANTFSEVLSHIKLSPHGGNINTLKRVLDYYKLDYSKFTSDLNKSHKYKYEVLEDSQLFTTNNLHSRNAVKRRILKKKLIPYVCEQCGQVPIWKGKPLVLVLDHINGINNDNRLENLRFLCPNCNSQQDTFCGRSLKFSHKKRKTSNILEQINRVELQEKINRIKNYNVDFSKYGWVTEVAKLENCSHTSIRRFMKKYMSDFYYSCYIRKNQFI